VGRANKKLKNKHDNHLCYVDENGEDTDESADNNLNELDKIIKALKDLKGNSTKTGFESLTTHGINQIELDLRKKLEELEKNQSEKTEKLKKINEISETVCEYKNKIDNLEKKIKDEKFNSIVTKERTKTELAEMEAKLAEGKAKLQAEAERQAEAEKTSKQEDVFNPIVASTSIGTPGQEMTAKPNISQENIA
jgi:nitrate/nitrite-specific signal transduction histidine kinase